MIVVDFFADSSSGPGRARTLFEGQYWSLGIRHGPTYDIHPDGQRFLMVEVLEPEPASIEITLNWFEELERLVPTDN